MIETDRIYVVRTRTNRRVQWKYADYQGRYRSVEEAIDVAKERLGNVPFEYDIENMITGEVITGFINWE